MLDFYFCSKYFFRECRLRKLLSAHKGPLSDGQWCNRPWTFHKSLIIKKLPNLYGIAFQQNVSKKSLCCCSTSTKELNMKKLKAATRPLQVPYILNLITGRSHIIIVKNGERIWLFTKQLCHSFLFSETQLCFI